MCPPGGDMARTQEQLCVVSRSECLEAEKYAFRALDLRTATE